MVVGVCLELGKEGAFLTLAFCSAVMDAAIFFDELGGFIHFTNPLKVEGVTGIKIPLQSAIQIVNWLGAFFLTSCTAVPVISLCGNPVMFSTHLILSPRLMSSKNRLFILALQYHVFGGLSTKNFAAATSASFSVLCQLLVALSIVVQSLLHKEAGPK